MHLKFTFSPNAARVTRSLKRFKMLTFLSLIAANILHEDYYSKKYVLKQVKVEIF